MQSSQIIHDPRAGLTPLQQKYADEARARAKRIASAEHKPEFIVIEVPKSVTIETPIPNEVIQHAWTMIDRTPPVIFGNEVDRIQRAVVRFYPGVTKYDITSTRREKTVVLPRQVAMYLAKKLTRKSLPDIGRRFGGRDHTTVLHSVRRIEERMKTDPDVAGIVAIISKEFAGAD